MSQPERVAVNKVLLVDDDGAVRDMMNQALTRKGFEVVTAASVPEALRHIADETFDVLITDLHMIESEGVISRAGKNCFAATNQIG